MTIEELSDVLGCDLLIRRYANQNNRYVANFEEAEIKDNWDSSILCSEYGEGGSPNEAIKDYVRKIRGKVIIVKAEDRIHIREFGVPCPLNC